jgi:hypothetical protein
MFLPPPPPEQADSRERPNTGIISLEKFILVDLYVDVKKEIPA